MDDFIQAKIQARLILQSIRISVDIGLPSADSLCRVTEKKSIFICTDCLGKTIVVDWDVQHKIRSTIILNSQHCNFTKQVLSIIFR